MLDVCVDGFKYALEAFEQRSQEKALKVIEKETKADGLEVSLRKKSISRDLQTINVIQIPESYFWMRLYVWNVFPTMQETFAEDTGTLKPE